MRFLNLAIVTLLFLNTPLHSVFGAQDHQKNKMLGCLEVIKHTLDVEYAPTEWKGGHFNWNLEAAYQDARDQIQSTKLTTKQFRGVLKDFVETTQDHHVSITFLSTERATLPFSVRSVNGKYFITWIDKDKLGPDFHLTTGDELVKFDGHPVEEEIQKIKSKASFLGNSKPDQALTELNLTKRIGARGDSVPCGDVMITVRSKADGKLRKLQFLWEYTPDIVTAYENLPGMMQMKPYAFENEEESLVSKEVALFSPVAAAFYAENEGGLGGRISFVPLLGEKTWNAKENSPFEAYIYRNEQGKAIGYVRIPTYIAELEDAEYFGKIMNYYEKHTDGLVIDQVHNGGGYLFYQYALASMIAKEPLVTPKQRLKLTQHDVLSAYVKLMKMEEITTDEEAKRELTGADNIIKNYQTVLFIKKYLNFIINEWEEGRILTNPTHLNGIDHINPHVKYHFSKPILVLIDELDFSAADFFPAIMQDNKRATLFGARTAGAGGAVVSLSFPNCYGINTFYYTSSIAERPDSTMIENLGVTPDIEYQLTEDDYQHGYQGYKAAVNHAINDLIDKESK